MHILLPQQMTLIWKKWCCWVWLQACCFGGTVTGRSNAPLTPSLPSVASLSLVPWSHTARLLHPRSCCPGVDGEHRCEEWRTASTASLQGMLMQLGCHLRADISHRTRKSSTSNSPPVIIALSLQETTLTCDTFCDPIDLLTPRLSCFLLPLDPAPFCYRFLFLSLSSSRVSRACCRLVCEAVGQRGTAVTSVHARMLYQISTSAQAENTQISMHAWPTNPQILQHAEQSEYTIFTEFQPCLRCTLCSQT